MLDLSNELHAFKDEKAIAVGLSGGPDSMALTHLLAAHLPGIAVHALSVDHGLRADSGAEVQQVGEWVKDWPNVTHQVLRWEGDKPESRIMEEARRARYDLMADYCAKAGIAYLFLAHHQDDQAETFLFRLAKGSGLDGLAGMAGYQAYDDKLTLVRPLLEAPKESLKTYCTDHEIPFVEDPSNENEDYARPRLRKSREVLEEEGLSAKRLAVSAARLARARQALEEIALQAFDAALTTDNGELVSFNMKVLANYPDEIILRVILTAMKVLNPDKTYGPRLEKVEALCARLLAGGDVKETLGGCIVELKEQQNELVIDREK